MGRKLRPKPKPIEKLPHKVFIRASGETVEMTLELRKQVGWRCAVAMVHWAKGEVENELGIR
ncbi:hypothetical protein EDM56_06790 [Brevibacillus fluminis]|uniref:Uncharacterized protein n=1 Tax=Brevibacillus fluminis TaxID=511487 RepID=A0A3M8DSX1_9BACL|nr:hypothetical protein [Brevibacillus fluminis]RNB91280.1 hypothetical protein EDM56_06790 [Brevibacillus fluminis]